MRIAPVLTVTLACSLLTLAVTPAVAPAGTPPIHDEIERAIVKRINDIRRDKGLRALKASRRLEQIASAHSLDQLIYDRLSHNSGDGTPYPVRAKRISTGRVGETVAWLPAGLKNRARRIARMWMDSPGHRAILLDGSFRTIGVGRRTGALGQAAGDVVTADLTAK